MVNRRALAARDLARVTRAEQVATQLWSGWLAAAPRRASTVMNGVGAVSVAPARLVAAPPTDPELRGGPVWFAGAAGAAFDAFAFDAAAAASLVSLLLGVAPPPAFRPLSALERGLLAAAAVPILGCLGLPGALSLHRAPFDGNVPARAALELSLRWSGGAGRAWITRGPGASEPAGAMVSDDGWQWLRHNFVVTVTCERARARLPALEWAAASVGDALLFAGHALSSLQPVLLRFGGLAAEAILDDDGDVRLVDAPRLDPTTRYRAPASLASPPSHSGAITMPDHSAPESSASATQPTSTRDPAEVLSSATVELVAEVGRTELRGAELVSLLEGAVLGLGTRSADLVVTLTCGGRPVARGTLVDVDGELGVRIDARLG